MSITQENDIYFFTNKNKEFLVKTFHDAETKISIKSEKIGAELIKILSSTNQIISFIDKAISKIQNYDDFEAVGLCKGIFDELGKIFHIFKIFDFIDLSKNFVIDFENTEYLNLNYSDNEIITNFSEEYKNLIDKEKIIKFFKDIKFELTTKKTYLEIFYGIENKEIKEFFLEYGIDIYHIETQDRLYIARIILNDTDVKYPSCCISYGIEKRGKIEILETKKLLLEFKKIFVDKKSKFKRDYITFKRYKLETLQEFFNLSFDNLITHIYKVNKCENCGKYFIPTKRSNEKYCLNLWENGKSCRELASKWSIENNQLQEIFNSAKAKAYSNKKRYQNNISNISKKFELWKNEIEKQRDFCKKRKNCIRRF